ncbi:T9SS type A sorting domain-containing protein, partial [Bacteroidales bacterium OttesenSCG-928-I14]|nr:T9SS type A sorting domain-containing protein [Bacteroidales bacterium OttesenSCG-928-I14]
TPFKNTQRGGYYAGNFVRKFLEDANKGGHVEYVLGNKDANGDGWIDSDQFVRDADEILVPGKGYLIEPRPSGYDYSQLPFDQTNGTAATVYDKGVFVFNGSVYNLVKNTEQIFADDELFKKGFSGSKFDNTVNWIIGNSYTSAISIDKLLEEMTNTGLNLSSTIYLYPAGSTSYIPYKMGSSTNVIDLTDIPSMTYFMVRLSKNKTQTGSFTVDRSMQTHGEISNNFLRASKPYENELVFRVSPEDNPNVYDLAMIALREKTSGSVAKVSNPQKNAFQLYAGSKMSIAIEPESTNVVPLGFVPSSEVTAYHLSVARTGSVDREYLWLEDTKTGEWVNLFESTEYTFTTDKNDREERFRVHFTNKPTGLDEIIQSPLSVYYAHGNIHIRGLVEEDLNAVIRISDVQGRTVAGAEVNTYPEQIVEADLVPGVYLVYIGGERNQTVKILVKGDVR